MAVVGVICEYNPFHRGHLRQFVEIRRQFGGETAVVCCMSGDFVQRGEPAVFSKFVRARAAVACGADLVVELPLTRALSSAEGFADGGVAVLDGLGCVDVLSFGSETGTVEPLMATAQVLLEPEFDAVLREELEKGVSFAAARARAAARLGGDEALLRCPNDILAVEYCKAILRRGSRLVPHTVQRQGDYHALEADPENPSATAVRGLMERGENWRPYVPEAAVAVLEGQTQHFLSCGERAVLARLRTMTDEDFARLPFASEGLHYKLAAACRRETSVAAIAAAVKSKRYAYARIIRMIQCAYLGLTAEDLRQPVPYVRALAFTDRGRALLRLAREWGSLPVVNAGEAPSDARYYALERRAADLYGLYARGNPEPGGAEAAGRIFYQKDCEKTLAK